MQLSHHALEQIQARGIRESEVSDAINFGARWRSEQDPTIHYARCGNLVVVLHNRGQWVITAYHVGINQWHYI